MVREVAHARQRNPLPDVNKILQGGRYPRRDHLCKFWWGLGWRVVKVCHSPLTLIVALTTLSQDRASVWYTGPVGSFTNINYNRNRQETGAEVIWDGRLFQGTADNEEGTVADRSQSCLPDDQLRRRWQPETAMVSVRYTLKVIGQVTWHQMVQTYEHADLKTNVLMRPQPRDVPE